MVRGEEFLIKCIFELVPFRLKTGNLTRQNTHTRTNTHTHTHTVIVVKCAFDNVGILNRIL